MLWPGVLVLLPGGDPVLSLDLPQRVVVWTDVVRTVKGLPDHGATLRQAHEAVPEGHHADDGRVDVLDHEQVPCQEDRTGLRRQPSPVESLA